MSGIRPKVQALDDIDLTTLLVCTGFSQNRRIGKKKVGKRSCLIYQVTRSMAAPEICVEVCSHDSSYYLYFSDIVSAIHEVDAILAA